MHRSTQNSQCTAIGKTAPETAHTAADQISENQNRQKERRQEQAVVQDTRRVMTSAVLPRVVDAHNENYLTQGNTNSPVVDNQNCKAAYEWNLVLNHASTPALTKIARNPHEADYEMEQIVADRRMRCRTCLRRKMMRTPHTRTEQSYTSTEAFCSDIVGPIRAAQLTKTPGPRAAQEKELYFIMFTKVATWFAYVAPIITRDKTSQLIISLQSLSTICQSLKNS